VSPAGTLRVGVDLVAVDEVAESVRHFGDRYVTRVYTPHEIESCRSRGDGRDLPGALVIASLAARFAAKEAVIKVLRPVEVQLDWRSIEIHRMTGGWCEIHLSGQAAAMAAEVGIDEFSVSMTHETSFAAAVVVGRCSSREQGVE